MQKANFIHCKPNLNYLIKLVRGFPVNCGMPWNITILGILAQCQYDFPAPLWNQSFTAHNILTGFFTEVFKGLVGYLHSDPVS